MKEKEFRKLEIDLPTQSVKSQLPWLVAGWLLVLAIFSLAAYAYFR
jgi:hypothetical protein